MPIRTQCPSCQAALGVPDGPARQRVRCPYCATIFLVSNPDATIPEAAPTKRPPVSVQPPPRLEKPRPSAVKRSAPPSIKASAPKIAPAAPKSASRTGKILHKAAGLPMGLLIGVAAGVAGMFLFLVGAVVLWLVLRSPATGPSSESQTIETVAAKGDPLAPEASRQMVRGSQAVPEAPPAAEGGEEFVDLPEREEVVQTVGGLNPDPKPGENAAGAPAVRPKIAITSAKALRVGGRPGVYFEINYRFEQGAPMPGMRYGWVIVSQRRGAFMLRLTADSLREQGTLKGHLRNVTSNLDAPFRIFLVAEVPGDQGMKEEKISNEMTIR